MRQRIRVRSAVADDFAGIATLIEDLGYPIRPEALDVTLRRMCGSAHHHVLVADADGAVAGLLVISCRPSLSVQGWIGGIEELVVRTAFRRREIGEILLQYAKGLAVELGLVRLECRLPSTHRRTGGDFLLERSFESVDEVTYHWSVLESRYPRLPAPATVRTLPREHARADRARP